MQVRNWLRPFRVPIRLGGDKNIVSIPFQFCYEGEGDHRLVAREGTDLRESRGCRRVLWTKAKCSATKRHVEARLQCTHRCLLSRLKTVSGRGLRGYHLRNSSCEDLISLVSPTPPISHTLMDETSSHVSPAPKGKRRRWNRLTNYAAKYFKGG